MKTYQARPSDIEQKWYVIDATGMVVGRLATQVAMILRGKHKPSFTPHQDTGDFVVITNAEKAVFTGKKESDKRYYRHTGHPGGIKETSPEKLRDSGKADRIIEQAVERMLPKDSPLARGQFKKLRVYNGAEHPHEAQQPELLDLASKNRKNKAA